MEASQPFEVVACPRCGGLTRLPESMRGAPVRCPHCREHFRVPSGGGPAEPLNPAASQRVSPTLPAGLVLLCCGLIGLLCDLGVVVLIQADPEAVRERILAQMQNPDALLQRWLEIPRELDPVEARARIDERLGWVGKLHLGFAAVSLLVAAGGVAMLRRRGYRLAVLGAILAMGNVGFFCCLLGVPAGVFALVRLLDPAVQADFRRG